MRLPVFDRLNTLAETCLLPPISLPLSFFVSVSAFPGLFKHLASVPFYRFPKTLGWPYSDAPLNGALHPHPPLARLDPSPLLSLLRVLRFFTPPSVRNKVADRLHGESDCQALSVMMEKLKRPMIGHLTGSCRTSHLTYAKASPLAIRNFINCSPPWENASSPNSSLRC